MASDAPAVHSVCVIGTLDTKGQELHFLADCLSSALSRFLPEVKVRMIDVSAKLADKGSSPGRLGVSIEEVLRHHPLPSSQSLSSLPNERGSAISTVSTALHQYLQALHIRGEIVGAIGVGGTGGTALIAPALRALPVGLPKLLVSTVASGNTSPYVESSDLILVPSVVDIAGLNSVSKSILSNASSALAGMVAVRGLGETLLLHKQDNRPTIGLTMYGVTTQCVDAVRKKLEAKGFEPLVFHGTGSGIKTMESLASQGSLQGVLDITTGSVADHVVGGIFACSDKRFEALIKQNIPLVLSVGALDIVAFGSKDTVPATFSHRNLVVHNEQITAMRTSAEEVKQAARFIANKINLSTAPVRVLLPEKGISALDAIGKPFYDKDTTATLFEELESFIKQSSDRQVKRFPYHINDVEFANELTNAFLDIFPSNLLPANGKTIEISNSENLDKWIAQ